jgi:hypothetical protein
MDASTLPLPVSVADDPLTMVNKRVFLRDVDGYRAVLVDHHLYFHYQLGQRAEEALIIGILLHCGLAGPVDLARAFGNDRTTVYRIGKRFKEEGAEGILPAKRGPKGPHKIDRSMRKQALRLKEKGLSNRGVAAHFGISEKSVRNILREADYNPPPPPSLPGCEPEGSGPNETTKQSVESAPLKTKSAASPRKPRPVAEAVSPRVDERTDARFGRIPEAAPVLESGSNLRFLGVLLAVPAILDLRLLHTVKSVYGSLRPGFYGLRSFVLTLVFMALLRIKRPEGLKGLPPEILGRHLGLDRSPEVKTVRRKLAEIADRRKSHEFLVEVARTIAADHEDLVGFLYVDGHVRAYHGKRMKEKTLIPRNRLCMPAMTDYWVNDASGDPLFFVTAEGHGGLSKALPGLLNDIRGIVGEDRRLTVIFDRGGWSTSLFTRMKEHFDFITYRRRPYDDLAADAFHPHETSGGKTWSLADEEVELNAVGKVRVVVRLDEMKDTQVHIVTTRRDLSAVEIVERMVTRWRQENFFKQMRTEYALDALISYEMVPADPMRLVVNPERREIEKQIRRLRKRICDKELEITKRSAKEEGRPTLDGFKSAMWEHGQTLADAKKELAKLTDKRTGIPKHVPHRTALGHEPMRLEFERKMFTDTLKMMAYRAESAMVAAVAPHYRRSADEARKLVCEMLRASGDIDVGPKEIRIALEPLSSPHRTAALGRLCAILNAQNAHYPGTDLILRYGVRGERDVANSTPSSCQEV